MFLFSENDLRVNSHILTTKLPFLNANAGSFFSKVLVHSVPEGWTVTEIEIPDINSDSKFWIFRSVRRHEQIVVLSESIDVILSEEKIFEQGWTVSTIDTKFHTGLGVFIEKLIERLLRYEPSSRESALAFKRKADRFFVNWKLLEVPLMGHIRAWQFIFEQIKALKQRAQEHMEYFPSQTPVTQNIAGRDFFQELNASVNNSSSERQFGAASQFFAWLGNHFFSAILGAIVSILATALIAYAGWSHFSAQSFQVDPPKPSAAVSTVSDFYRYWNLHRFEDARNLLTTQYAKNEENFSLEKMQEFALKINGGITILNLKLLENESKENVKVYDYTTRYTLKSDGNGHGEQLRAYVVFRNEAWTIDTIQVQSLY